MCSPSACSVDGLYEVWAIAVFSDRKVLFRDTHVLPVGMPCKSGSKAAVAAIKTRCHCKSRTAVPTWTCWALIKQSVPWSPPPHHSCFVDVLLDIDGTAKHTSSTHNARHKQAFALKACLCKQVAKWCMALRLLITHHCNASLPELPVTHV